MKLSVISEFVLVSIVITAASCGPGFVVSDRAHWLKIRADSKILPIIMSNYENRGAYLKDGQALSILAQKNRSNPDYKPTLHGSKDPWENPYILRVDSLTKKRQIWCLGADGKQGGTEKDADFVIGDESTWPAWLKAEGEGK